MSKNQEISQIEKIENVIFNSLEGQQYHENTCFRFERMSENKTKLHLSITKYGLVPVTAIKKMIADLESVSSLGNIIIYAEDIKTFIFESTS